ncbi:Hsp20/alpha crystallin family protein [Bacillus sp. Marseille-P3661]|uniref:Hsp20/alpha crystallin family protein n=1 Tax=Bacillus sp. Marseille-P3661 TaxID=1936234 RepID=UPI000C821EC1|nr:Hsp20/alpha crystallin family protein [Bacillus sp. Marseille-P3661]
MDDFKKQQLQSIKDLHELMNQFFDDPFTSLFQQPFQVDVYDMGNKILVEAELPGFELKQIKIQPVYEGLRIVAEDHREIESFDSKKNYYKKERSINKLERIIPLPLEVTPQNTKAHYKNGILEIQILKNTGKGNKQSYIDIE